MVTRGRSLSNEKAETHHHHIYYNDIHYITHVNTDKYIYTHMYTLIHK